MEVPQERWRLASKAVYEVNKEISGAATALPFCWAAGKC